MTKPQTAVETMNFETALAELETIVRNLETGKTSLEDSISSYERGVSLRNHCEKKLREAQAKIEKITVNPDGTVSVKPFEEQE